MKSPGIIFILLSFILNVCIGGTIRQKLWDISDMDMFTDNKQYNEMLLRDPLEKFAAPRSERNLNDFDIKINVNENVPWLDELYETKKADIHKNDHEIKSEGENEVHEKAIKSRRRRSDEKDNDENDSHADDHENKAEHDHEKGDDEHDSHADDHKDKTEHDHDSHTEEVKSRHRSLTDKSSEESSSEEQDKSKNAESRHRRTLDDTSSEKITPKLCGCASKLQDPEREKDEHILHDDFETRHRRSSNDNSGKHCGCAFEVVTPEIEHETHSTNLQSRQRRTPHSFPKSHFLDLTKSNIAFHLNSPELSNENIEINLNHEREPFYDNQLTETKLSDVIPLPNKSTGITSKEEQQQLFIIQNELNNKNTSPTGDLFQKFDLGKYILKNYPLFQDDALVAYLFKQNNIFDTLSTHESNDNENFANDYVQGCEGFEENSSYETNETTYNEIHND